MAFALTESQGTTTAGLRSGALAVLLGWLVFFLLWSLFILGFVQGDVGAAVRAGAIATVHSALGSILVWRLTGRIPWPSPVGAGFVLLHVVMATIFSLVWTALGPVVAFLLEGASLSEIPWTVPENGWRLLMGYWLYVILAGLSYTVRNQRLARQEQARAQEARAAEVRARLGALRSQLHPHFLFNALHTVMALVRTDPERAEAALELLGELLRYAIADRGEELVSLGEELDFAIGYLELQRLRHGERLLTEIIAEDEVRAVRIPPFTLQPLVENAVIHGLGRTESGTGTIRVTVTRGDATVARGDARVIRDKATVIRRDAAVARGDATVVLRVEDTGAGLDPDAPAGSGLANLRTRLHARYGTAATLAVAHRPGGGTLATVTIPIAGTTASAHA